MIAYPAQHLPLCGVLNVAEQANQPAIALRIPLGDAFGQHLYGLKKVEPSYPGAIQHHLMHVLPLGSVCREV